MKTDSNTKYKLIDNYSDYQEILDSMDKHKNIIIEKDRINYGSPIEKEIIEERFQTIKEINENMPLEIEPTPDTIVRIVMEYKGLEEPIEIAEQKLATPNRDGFTVVEWGGTEIK